MFASARAICPASGLRVPNALQTAEAIATLPSVQAALVIRGASAEIDRASGLPLRASFQGVATRSTDPAGSRLRAPWTILRGRDADAPDEVVIDEQIAVRVQARTRQRDHDARVVRRRSRSAAGRRA